MVADVVEVEFAVASCEMESWNSDEVVSVLALGKDANSVTFRWVKKGECSGVAKEIVVATDTVSCVRLYESSLPIVSSDLLLNLVSREADTGSGDEVLAVAAVDDEFGELDAGEGPCKFDNDDDWGRDCIVVLEPMMLKLGLGT